MSAIPASTKLSALSDLLTQLQDLGPQTKLEARSQGNHPGMHVTHNDIHHHLTELQLAKHDRERQDRERRRALDEVRDVRITPAHWRVSPYTGL